jgi:rhodanese-related sulfurtransferase
MKQGRNRNGRRRAASAGTVMLVMVWSVFAAPVTAQELTVEPRDTASLEALIAAGESGADYVLIDVRTPEEYAGGHIPTAINIDYREIGDALSGMDRDQPIVLYCRSGNRSGRAERTLQRMGFTDVVDFGGIIHWNGSVTTGSE